MKKKLMIFTCFLLGIGLLAFPIKICAAGSSISASSTTVYVGDQVTVSVAVSGSRMYTVKGSISSSNSGVLSGGAGVWRKADLTAEPDGFSYASESATFTANSTGSAVISFIPEGNNSIDVDGAGLGINGSQVTINVIARPSSNGNSGNNSGGNSGSTSGGNSGTTTTPTENEDDTKSKDSNLASLSISEGKLSPDFSADVTEYTVDLAANVTSIKVDAKAADSKATVSGTGDVKVKPGENKITVTVTAENGSTKAYVITATVDEKPLIFMNYNKLKLGVVRNTDAVTAPDGFEKTTIKMNGKDVTAWTNKAMNTTIIYLVDEKTSEKNFYVYDTAKKAVSTVFKPTAILGQNVFIIDVEEDLQKQEGLTYKKVKVDTVELMGWEFNDKTLKNYALIYVMDGNGKKVYYQYEKTQNTLQLYSGAAPVSKATYEDMAKDLDSANLMRNIFIGVSVLLAITTAAGFVLAMKNKKGSVQK